MNLKVFISVVFSLISSVTCATTTEYASYKTEYQALENKFISEDDYVKLRSQGYQANDIYKIRSNIFGGEINFTLGELIELKKEAYLEKKKNKKNSETSSRLASEGRDIYKANSFSYEAYQKYDLAAAWLPKPEYLLILGDIAFRMKLKKMLATESYGQNSCVNKYVFAYEADQVIDNFFEIGLGVAERLQMHSLKKSPLFYESRKRVACIESLISRYVSEVSDNCVSPKDFEYCLAEPLPIK